MENIEEIKDDAEEQKVDLTPEKLQEISRVKNLIASMIKAKRNLKLYPSNNPIYLNTIESVHVEFGNFFSTADELQLKVAKNDLYYENQSVYHSESKEDNLALFFFRDGMREITFKSRIKEEELQDFLEVISTDLDREDVEDDLVTLLWEKDFSNITYKVDESAIMEDDGYDEEATEQAKAGVMQQDQITQAYQDAFKPQKEDKVSLIPITEADLQTLLKMMDTDALSKTPKFLNMLRDMLVLAESIDDITEVARIMKSTVEYNVREENFIDALVVFEIARGFAAGDVSEGVREGMKDVISHSGFPDLLGLLVRHLDINKIPDDDYEKFVSYLGVNALPGLIDQLVNIRTMLTRKKLLDVIVELGKKDSAPIYNALRHDRVSVVRDVISVISRLHNKTAVEPLIGIIRHGDAKVRREVITLLGELGGAIVVPRLRDFVHDPDESVRMAAVRALGRTRAESALSVLLDTINSKGFKDMDFEVMKSFFEALSNWKDDVIMLFLMDIVKRNPLFGRAKHNELKACAVHCLGLIGNKQSIGAIEGIKAGSNRILSEHVRIALKRLQSDG